MQCRPSLVDPDVGVCSPTLLTGLKFVALLSLGDQDDVCDAVQEALLRTLSAVREARVPVDVPLDAYAHGILRHVVIDTLRDRIRRRSLGGSLTEAWPSPAPGPLETLIASERAALVRDTLGRLAPSDRRLLALVYQNDERVIDIAKQAGVPPARLRQRKSRALKRLRRLLRGCGDVATPRPESDVTKAPPHSYSR